ncbi:hypothetical protein, partial [Dyella sp. EPa41]|uniref:hypothetical protein n=1 Tax=Dyella sp. EPa41 TaxID=1561194 RepID=UPI001F161290
GTGYSLLQDAFANCLTGVDSRCVSCLVMRIRYRLSRRRRALLAGVVMFCLMFQQLAMAAYVCTLPAKPVAIGMKAHCAGMGMDTDAKASTQANPDPRCDEHCAGHATTAPDARVPMVPPLMLPPASPAQLGSITHATEQAALPDATLFPPDPPPTLRFCSLLI